MTAPLLVLKLGGSVLTSCRSLPDAVAEIGHWRRAGYRLLVVVSAEYGETDRLERDAARLSREPNPHALASLLATGEQRSASRLVLALGAAGVEARLLEHHHLALRTHGAALDAEPRSVDLGRVREALATAPVVVAPGYSGLGASGETTLLGRGGSDLTALVLAADLSADRCRLVKNVPGWLDADPAGENGRPPRRYQTLSWDDALASGADVVQPKAVAWARAARVSFEVGPIGGGPDPGGDGAPAGTLVGAYPTCLADEEMER